MPGPMARRAGPHSRIQAYRDLDRLFADADYALLPIGDRDFESADATTFQTVGRGAGEGLTFTYSEARTAFNDPTQYRSNQLQLPDVPFSIDEDADSPNAAFWSRDDSAGEAYSVGLVFLARSIGVFESLYAKWHVGNGLREWFMGLRADGAVNIAQRDESAGVDISRRSTVISAGRFTTVMFTSDARGGVDAADGINAYINGQLANGVAVNNASYVAMEPTNTVVTIASRTQAFGNVRILGGADGPVFYQRELTASQVARWHSIVRAAQQ